MSLIRPIHDLVNGFLAYEQTDIAQQLRRASKSVPANIAEGFSRRVTARDFKFYLAHALGSANEVMVHLMIAAELEYAPSANLDSLISQYRIVAKQLGRLIQVWRDPAERQPRTRDAKPRLIQSDHRPPSHLSAKE
jgi:four helix bundle protein